MRRRPAVESDEDPVIPGLPGPRAGEAGLPPRLAGRLSDPYDEGRPRPVGLRTREPRQDREGSSGKRAKVATVSLGRSHIPPLLTLISVNG